MLGLTGPGTTRVYACVEQIKNNFTKLTATSAVLLCTACQTLPEQNRVVIDELAKEYLREFPSSSDRAPTLADASIKLLEVTGDQTGENASLSAQLENAPLAETLKRIAALTGLSIDTRDISSASTATTMFRNLPLADALNLILAPEELSAKVEAGRITVVSGVAAASDAAADTIVQTQVLPKYLKSNTAITMLSNFYKSDQSGDGYETETADFEDVSYPFVVSSGGRLSVSRLPGHSAIYMSGQLSAVLDAVRLLHFGDQERPHVVLEALVIEADAFALKNLGLDLVNISSGDVNTAAFAPGSEFLDTITLNLLSGANNPTSLEALVSMLEVQENATIVARPFASTLSHEEANIEISQDRYVVVEDAARTRSIRPLTAGILLNLTPEVLGDDNIRISVDVEASEFISPPDSTNVVVEKSTAKTVVEIKDGQTLVIGGLYRNSFADENAGVPGVRRVPFLNFFTSRQAESSDETEVIIYITPRIWTKDSRGIADLNALVGPDADESEE